MVRKTVVIFLALLLVLAMSGVAGASDCETVDTSRGNLTANVVNPGTVDGNVDGTGCDIAVYFDEAGTVDGADITVGDRSREHFSVFVDGANVDVRDSGFSEAFVHILYAEGANGDIVGNHVEGYERGAIVVSGGETHAEVKNNMVEGDGDREGDGPAQNGIQVSYGATGKVVDNTVNHHWWGGSGWASSGILVFESDGVKVKDNTLSGNEVGVGIESWAWSATPTTSADNNQVVNNDISQSVVGISVSSIAWRFSDDDPTANNNKVVGNTVEDTDSEHSVVIAAIDDHEDHEPSTDNTKLIRNSLDKAIDDKGSATKTQPSS